MLLGLALVPTMAGTGGTPPAPVLTSLSFDQFDVLGGGTDITITGTDLGSASLCEVGTGGTWTSCTINANTSTTLDFTPPAKTAGSYSVRVTTPGGLSNTLAIEAWAPSTLGSTVKLLCEAPDYANPTWTARVGSNLTEAGTAPTASSGAPDFDGSTMKISATSVTWSSLVTLGAGTVFVGVHPDSAASPGTNVYDDECFVGIASQGRITVAHNTSGLRAGIYDGAYQVVPAFGGNLSSSRHLCGMRWDSTNVQAVIDGGSFASNSVTAGAIDTLSGATIQLGANYNTTAWFDGRELFVVAMDTSISDANKTKMYKWARQRHGTIA